MRYLLAASITLALVACVPTEKQSDNAFSLHGDIPYVEISSGGTFSGGESYTIFANDTMRTTSYEPFSADGSVAEDRLPPGAHARARAIAAAKMPGIAARAGESDCPEDYGSYSVRVFPPVSGITVVFSDCRSNDISNLSSDILRSISSQ